MKLLRIALGDLVRGLLAMAVVITIIALLTVAWAIFPGAMLIVTSVVLVLAALMAIGAVLREDGLL